MSDHSSFGRISILPDQNLDPRRLLTVMAPSAPPERQSLKPEDPLAECDSAKNLRSERFGDLYASTHDPIGESEHVFLNGNQLQKRWREVPEKSVHFHVGELGFGTGLNFLLTWKLWVETKDKNPGWRGLHYSGFEEFPLSADLMQTTHQNWLKQAGPEYKALHPYAKRLLNQWRCLMIGVHRFALDSSVILDLHVDDANIALAQRAKHSPPMNAWFLDGFSPHCNPELWKPDLFSLLVKHSTSTTTISTYTSAGHVRRNLGEAGLPVERTKGWGHKRHMLVSAKKTDNHTNPQHSFEGTSGRRKAVVIGAGLAGCTVAQSLASRGWQVTIMDPATGFGAGASGIPQLALRLRLFNTASAAAQIYLQAYLFTHRWLLKLASEGRIDWHGTQIIQLATAMNKRKPLNPERLKQIYGHALFQAAKDGTLSFPLGGWVDPVELCQTLCTDPNIITRFSTAEPTFEADQHGWQVQADMNAEPETADALIIASPQMLEKLPILNAAKLEFTTGISTAVDSSSELEKHEHILTGSRSLFPARGNAHLISATYQRCRAGSSHSKAANQDNLAAIADMLQLSSYNSFKVLSHYERERANTSDRMPLIGRYQDPMAKHDLTHPIFVSSAHGSTGLATCPFAAELVAADICGETLPVTEEQRLTLDPSRFDQRIQRKISSILASVE